MAFAAVSSVKASSTGGNSITTGSIDTTGANLLVATIGWYIGAGNASISDSKGNTWSPLTQRSTGFIAQRLWYVANPTVGTGHTFTANGSGMYPSIVAASFSGAHASAPFDQENGATGTSSTLSTGSVTPSEDNELLVAALGHENNSGGAVSINSSFTILQTAAHSANNEGSSLAYLIQTSAAAANPQWNMTNAVALGNAATIATFKAAAGGGGGGSTLTTTASDNHAVSETLAVLTSSFRAASDSIGITDDAVRACQVFRTSEDNVALSDTVDRACQNLRSVQDNVACSDTVERVVEYFRAVADSIGIADEVLREISGIREISVADSLALSEAYLQVVSYFRDLAESLAFTEDFQRQVDYYRQVSDSIAILESLITALNGIVITPPEEEEEEAETLDVEEDLYAYLLGCHLVTNLIGTRLYPVEAPKEATRPFIVYEILTRDRDDTQAGENGLVRVGIQFDCQAATYTAVREIEEALRGRFYRFFHQYMGTTFVQSAEISDATDEDSPPVFADAQGIYHSRVDLELWYEEAAIADGTEV